MSETLLLATTLVVTSVLAVLAALLLAVAWQGRKQARSPGQPASAAMFLLAPGMVLDANRRGRAVLQTLRESRSDDDSAGAASNDMTRNWDALLCHLTPVFPQLVSRLDAALQSGADIAGGEVKLTATDDSGRQLTLTSCKDALVRLVLSDAAAKGAATADGDALLVDRLSWQALRDENALLQSNVDLAPMPVWRRNAEGQIIWANAAYMRLLSDLDDGRPVSWPLPALFPSVEPGATQRHGLPMAQRGRQLWFDLLACRDGDTILAHALPADEAQKAERTRREFVQTLSRTFATLPIGLAVFDRTRRLHLFNPALTDLTRLEPEFLASRPGLDGFLNRMRDKRILPEPRDYKLWSRRLLDVETAAASGGFEETWSLPDGRSFRVSVSPHPDGALAFLIEDVTEDMRLKRSFRAELEIGQAALDIADSAIAVFGADGEMVMTNAAFDHLWNFEGTTTLAGVRLTEAIGSWRSLSADQTLWNRLQDLARPGGLSRSDVSGQLLLDDGETLNMRARACPSGGVIVSFTGNAVMQNLHLQAELQDARHRATA